MHATVGTGTFGRVRVVQHRPSGAFYALKIMKKAEVRVATVWSARGGHSQFDKNARGFRLTLRAAACSRAHCCHRGCNFTPAPPQILRLKQVDHIKSEVKLLSSIRHPFIVNLCVAHQRGADESEPSRRRHPPWRACSSSCRAQMRSTPRRHSPPPPRCTASVTCRTSAACTCCSSTCPAASSSRTCGACTRSPTTRRACTPRKSRSRSSTCIR